MRRDLAYGLMAALVVAYAIIVYSAGTAGGSGAGLAGVLAAGLGAALGCVAAVGLAGRRPWVSDLLPDAIVSGLLAVAASAAPLWKAPVAGADLLRLSAFGAALSGVLYHVANTISFAARRRHLGLLGGGVLVVLPFASGCLLGLQPGALAEQLGGRLAVGLATPHPDRAAACVRVALLLVVNELTVNAFSLGLRRMLLPGLRARLCLVACAVGAVLAPSVADLGSVAGPLTASPAWRPWVVVAATALSQGLLWAEVFLLTGVLLDGLRSQGPTWRALGRHALRGLTSGAMFSGVLMALVLVGHAGVRVAWSQAFFTAQPVLWLVLVAAGLFPLLKTIVETFDGSEAFLQRVLRSYSDPALYARGAVVGLGIGMAAGHGLTGWPMGLRAWIGGAVGAVAYGGMSLVRDLVYRVRGLGRLQSWRLYGSECLLGAGLGAALFFYMDAAQLEVVRHRLLAYDRCGGTPAPFDIYPIISKWGYLVLGPQSGGAKLLFNQALMGAICWAIAAWLFAINRAFLLAALQRQWAPVRNLATREGFAGLLENTIQVMRWGLWMSPIIATFLWQMGTPTWFNQDGAIHTLAAIVRNVTLSPADFAHWSREVFLWVLVYGVFRVVIWLDHMGLRVATLVNLSFIGLDRLDERVARFIGPAVTVRFIPEGVKRFATWAPLLIPYYIPAGADWDYVWTTSSAVLAASHGWVESLRGLPAGTQAALLAGCVALGAAASAAGRGVARRRAARAPRSHGLRSRRYEVTARADGEVRSRLTREGFDVTRRSYEGLDPAGRALFVVDAEAPAESPGRWWPVVGNWPAALFPKAEVRAEEGALVVGRTAHGIRTTVRITLAGDLPAAEQWEIELHNEGDAPRQLKVVPYLEWVLNSAGADRSHTQYNRLFSEVEYVAGLHAVFARHRGTRKVGLLAADVAPEGFLMSRVDFIGRACSLWSPRALQTLRFHVPRDTGAAPDFDPAACLLLGVAVPPRERRVVRLLIGCANSRPQASGWVRRSVVRDARPAPEGAHAPPSHVRHGRRPPGVPPAYVEMRDGGRTMRVLTPYTPLPYDHTMANAAGHILAVTNRGLHSSASVNAQQNRLTTEWADIVTRELPSEAIYLFDESDRAWYSPTYDPLRDGAARHQAEFSVDGTAAFRMEKGPLATELVAFVPPADPVGVYLLSVTNRSDRPRQLRVAPYFQMVLADMPEHAGPLRVRHDRRSGALYFENPRNVFRSGTAFAAMSLPAAPGITQRSRFFGPGRPVTRPLAVEQGSPAAADPADRAPVAAFLGVLEVGPGATRTVAIVLGQAGSRSGAAALVERYRSVATAQAALEATRRWWNGFTGTLKVRTNRPEFDGYLAWLQYQTLAERCMARKGFYQASGAYGFRDQLQDTVNLVWVDPSLARRQLCLHAAQQFVEGDVAHWFFLQQDGRTGLLNRSHASDNLLWLVWGVIEYVRMTGDTSLLDERVSYLRAHTPLVPLPRGKHGMVGFACRTTREETVYRHCLRALDRVLARGVGRHGLPLMGMGDWNDGLDAIGAKGRGESVWLGFFLYRLLGDMLPWVEGRGEARRADAYRKRRADLGVAVEAQWRDGRYLRAIHDDGTEIGLPGSGSWEVDALMGAWPALAGLNMDRARMAFDTAVRFLEKERVILLGWPPLREHARPALGRSSHYPAGVRENGMYCHGVQWLVGAARLLCEHAMAAGDAEAAEHYRQASLRLWWKISPLQHALPEEIEVYGGQPNKQAADMLTGPDAGRMIWNGYTGAAGWMLRQACEGVLGIRLADGKPVPPADRALPRGGLVCERLERQGTSV